MTEIEAQRGMIKVRDAAQVEITSRSRGVRRLLVLIPERGPSLTPAARRIWELAKASGASVLLLGLCRHEARRPGLKRELITMSAMMRDGSITADFEIVSGPSWVTILRARGAAGDMVVCLAGDSAAGPSQSLRQLLQSDLDLPVYMLFDAEAPAERPTAITQLASLAGSLAIIGAFFLLQVRLDHIATGWPHLALELVGILIEVWIIWLWNSRFA